MKKQMSETFLIGAILAVVGGYLDAYTLRCRGHVFANAQTGNIVLLGVKAAEREWPAHFIMPSRFSLLYLGFS